MPLAPFINAARFSYDNTARPYIDLEPQNVQGGKSLIAMILADGYPVNRIEDTAGNAWFRLTSVWPGSGSQVWEFWCVRETIANAANVARVYYDNPTGTHSAYCGQYNFDVATGGTIAVAAIKVAGGGGTSMSSDAVDIPAGWLGLTWMSGLPSFTAGSGYAVRSSGNYFGVQDQYFDVAVTGHVAGMNCAGSAGPLITLFVKEASASSGDLSGTATLDGPTVSGGASSNPPSSASGALDLDGPTVSGGAGSGSGTITITLRVDGNLLAPGEVVDVVKIERMDGSVAVAAASRTSNGSGQIPISSTTLLPGTSYIVSGWNAAGTRLFIDCLQAT